MNGHKPVFFSSSEKKSYLSQSIEELQKDEAFLSKKYFENFSVPYPSTNSLYGQVRPIIGYPLYAGAWALLYAIGSAAQLIFAIGNFAIFRLSDSVECLAMASVSAGLAISLAMMVPVHAFLKAAEALARILASWLAPEPELAKDCSKDEMRESANGNRYCQPKSVNFLQLNVAEKIGHLRKYSPRVEDKLFNDAKPFQAFQGLGEAIFSFGQIVGFPILSGGEAVVHIFHGLKDSLDLITNIILLRPNHAVESLEKTGLDVTLAAYSAVMAPVSFVAQGASWLSRLPPTWVEAVCSPSHSY